MTDDTNDKRPIILVGESHSSMDATLALEREIRSRSGGQKDVIVAFDRTGHGAAEKLVNIPGEGVAMVEIPSVPTTISIPSVLWKVPSWRPDGEGTRPASPEERQRFIAAECQLVHAIETVLVSTTRTRRSRKWRRNRPGNAAELASALQTLREHEHMTAWMTTYTVTLADWCDDRFYNTVSIHRKPTYKGRKVRHWRRHHFPKLVDTPEAEE